MYYIWSHVRCHPEIHRPTEFATFLSFYFLKLETDFATFSMHGLPTRVTGCLLHPIQNPNLLKGKTRKPSLQDIRNLYRTKSLDSRLYLHSHVCQCTHMQAKGLYFVGIFFQIDPIKDSGLVISSSYHCLRQHNHPEESW